ncbi:preprotein translocase subunit SecE [Cyanobium sp. N5-Cardenillas]|nr:preprotein translocase subunit SecE [Cyanobium sp. N5-Cardenillas]
MLADVTAAIGIHTVEPIPPVTTTTSSPDGPLAQRNGLSEPDEGPDGAAPEEEAPSGFLAVTLAELRKVVWPSRQQLFSESVAVILMVSLSAAAIAAIDRFYHWGSAQIFR